MDNNSKLFIHSSLVKSVTVDFVSCVTFTEETLNGHIWSRLRRKPLMVIFGHSYGRNVQWSHMVTFTKETLNGKLHILRNVDNLQ